MQIVKNFNLTSAIGALQKNTQGKEYNFFKCHSEYLWSQGRKNIYEVILDHQEISELITDKRGDENKVREFIGSISRFGYEKDSLLFLRDCNQGEIGSFYVENGVHRTRALQFCSANSIAFGIIKAILFSKNRITV